MQCTLVIRRSADSLSRLAKVKCFSIDCAWRHSPASQFMLTHTHILTHTHADREVDTAEYWCIFMALHAEGTAPHRLSPLAQSISLTLSPLLSHCLASFLLSQKAKVFTSSSFFVCFVCLRFRLCFCFCFYCCCCFSFRISFDCLVPLSTGNSTCSGAQQSAKQLSTWAALKHPPIV